ncbi:hypothetical protein FXF59_34100 [Microbispora tritici]|uniref:HTH luxR-type domain-containing protein n=3 Tax=Streptosporangiaceae TaxID=2004 RepID=A0ABY3LMQ5_9ACTN|nr:hypothetical protein FED44_27335 [Microbispora fusca]TYB43142.1 hypothetical protein FXF59_34100 [Microbispora tritici]
MSGGASTMPYWLPAIVGRKKELAVLKNLITGSRTRFVTVTGPLGVGKSRLALECFSEIAPRFPGGAYFCDFTESHDTGRPERSVLAAVPEGWPGDRADMAWDAFKRDCGKGPRLLVLDHCETAGEPLRALVAELLASCADLNVIAFSREPLRVYGEFLFRLAPLATPPRSGSFIELAGAPSVELFLDIARAVRPEFQLNEANVRSVAGICRELDGLPLAITMAAARTKILGPNSIYAGVREDVNDLSGDSAGTFATKYADLRSATEISLCGVSARELTILSDLTVFCGSFSLSASAAVIGAGEESFHRQMESLLDKNLLLTIVRPDGELMFSMLQTTRDHLRRRGKGAGAGARSRYISYFRGLAKTAATASGEKRQQCREQLVQSREDVIQVCRMLIDLADHSRAVGTLHLLRDCSRNAMHTRDERGILDEVLRRGSLTDAERARALRLLGEIESEGDPDLAHRRVLDALAISTGLPDADEVARCHSLLGRVALVRGDLRGAEACLSRATSSVSATRSYRHALEDLARVHLYAQNAHMAQVLGERALRANLDAGDRPGGALSLFVLAEVAADAGEVERARELLTRALSLLSWPEDREELIIGLELLAAVLARTSKTVEQWRQTAKVLAAIIDAHRDDEHPVPSRRRERVNELADKAKQAIGLSGFKEERDTGMLSTPAEVFAEALSGLLPEHDRGASSQRCHAPLTDREFEVAKLVSQGLTNREIGRELGIAEWTVVNHLRKIMKKLDCSSRVFVAKWVLDTD